ncbi:wnt inhibitor of Dorsal protein-like [Haematobia irritans]|uniref:wnt inhibitor of Dorsal protein-like n=1 Tax=Haematobia irritans TaxID=7368 RepID=UPI003F4F7676
MYHSIIFTTIIIVALAPNSESLALLDKINFIARQSQYANQVYGQMKVPIPLDNVMASSMEIALGSCQSTFKWDHWNCPTSDFIRRRSSKSPLMDREDAYVNAISTAALLYTIAKNCSSGSVSGCVPCSSQCSDNPKFAEKLFQQLTQIKFSEDFYGKLSSQNYKAITNLLEKSLTKQCMCAVMGPRGVCSKEICLDILKPFEEIAKDIHQMYDEALELSNTPENSRIMWENIPLDVLVYMNDSPNYCEPDAVPLWNGMGGRQCSTGANGDTLSAEESSRCRQLCNECGYTVTTKNVITENRCNCKFTWGFQVQCEMCITVQKIHYCY